MKNIKFSIFIILSILTTSCSSFYTFNKYATGRFYTIYQSNGASACYFKQKFNDCAEKIYFDVKISDDNNKLALAKFITQSDDVSYFGFTRDNFPLQTKPIRDFLVWAKEDHTDDKTIKMKRPAGNVAGSFFESEEVEYTFQFTHTRAGIPILIINNGGSNYYGLTYDESKKLLELIDSWYKNSFSGNKIF